MEPSRARPAGYAFLIKAFGLQVGPRVRISFIGAHGTRLDREGEGRRTVVYPPHYDPGPELGDHLELALKHEGVDLEVLAGAFDPRLGTAAAEAIERWVRGSPTSAYARRAWFLHEFLTARRLELPDAAQGNYVPALDPERYFTATPVRSRRHRVLDNLLGPGGAFRSGRRRLTQYWRGTRRWACPASPPSSRWSRCRWSRVRSAGPRTPSARALRSRRRRPAG